MILETYNHRILCYIVFAKQWWLIFRNDIKNTVGQDSCWIILEDVER